MTLETVLEKLRTVPPSRGQGTVTKAFETKGYRTCGPFTQLRSAAQRATLQD